MLTPQLIIDYQVVAAKKASGDGQKEGWHGECA
jgi:hypothetical protein